MLTQMALDVEEEGGAGVDGGGGGGGKSRMDFLAASGESGADESDSDIEESAYIPSTFSECNNSALPGAAGCKGR